MAETNKLTTFVLDGTTLNIVDPTARSSAATATSNANTALSTAQTAESKAATAQSTATTAKTTADKAASDIVKLAAEPRLTAVYDQASSTLTMTTVTHSIS